MLYTAPVSVPVNRRLLEPGDRVGRFEIVADIAQGGMASVHVARLTSIGGFGKLVALKVLLPHLRADRAFVNMLLDEARIAASIHHPNVVQVLDVAEADGSPYVAMELLRGHSLRGLHRTARKGGETLPLGVLLGILARAAEGLHAAHEAMDDGGAPLGVVHRDVSPENIHVGYDGQVKVVDFGIAAAAGRLTETTHGEVKGKVQYLAPEQLSKARPPDRRVDVWALGVVAQELLTDRRLFAGEDMSTTMWNVLNLEVPSLAETLPELPESAVRIIGAALERDVDRRPGTCAEVMNALDAAATELRGGTKAELSALMLHLYQSERATENERIAAATRDRPAPPFQEIEDEEAVPTVRENRPEGSRGRAMFVVAAVALAAIVGGAVFVMRSSPPEAPTTVGSGPETVVDGAPAATSPTPTRADAGPSDVAPQVTPQVSQQVTQQITIEVDDRARLVLVDGERRDERPLLLDLGGAPVHVEVVGPQGEIVAHDLGVEDDGTRLVLPRAPTGRRGPSMRRRGGRSPGMMTTAPMEPSRDIVRGVF